MTYKKRHPIHRYQRTKLGSITVWRCILNGCLHYIRDEFIIGQESLCRCGRTFTMDLDKRRRKTPKCDLCQSKAYLQQKGIAAVDEVEKDKVGKTTVDIKEINIDDLLEGLE